MNFPNAKDPVNFTFTGFFFLQKWSWRESNPLAKQLNISYLIFQNL